MAWFIYKYMPVGVLNAATGWMALGLYCQAGTSQSIINARYTTRNQVTPALCTLYDA